jgi:hypothetical protein
MANKTNTTVPDLGISECLRDIQNNDPVEIRLSTTVEIFWINFCEHFSFPFLFLPSVTYICTFTVSIPGMYIAEINIHEEKEVPLRTNCLFSFHTTRTWQKTKKKITEGGVQIYRHQADVISLIIKQLGGGHRELGDLTSLYFFLFQNKESRLKREVKCVVHSHTTDHVISVTCQILYPITFSMVWTALQGTSPAVAQYEANMTSLSRQCRSMCDSLASWIEQAQQFLKCITEQDNMAVIL